ncbi:hypothetical protein [Lysinibacillus fusiformis]|uniref:hypothetical protein n=1 Tax=Lysinibacillus fusiformis TaxID=28031 RepID=UPI001ABFD8A7|nr:hypothetical protein [Lysinibacillus fusiformis]
MKGLAPKKIETVINPKKKGSKLSIAQCRVVPTILPPTVANQTIAVSAETTNQTPIG